MIRPLTICVDFDGTCTTHDFPRIGKDIGAPEVLHRLVKAGHKLILYTMRSNCEGNVGFSHEFPTIIDGPFLDEAKNWFADHNIPLYSCQVNPTQHEFTTSPKCYSNLYIDDAAAGAPLTWDQNLSNRPFIDWERMEHILENTGVLEPLKTKDGYTARSAKPIPIEWQKYAYQCENIVFHSTTRQANITGFPPRKTGIHPYPNPEADMIKRYELEIERFTGNAIAVKFEKTFKDDGKETFLTNISFSDLVNRIFAGHPANHWETTAPVNEFKTE